MADPIWEWTPDLKVGYIDFNPGHTGPVSSEVIESGKVSFILDWDSDGNIVGIEVMA